MKYLDPSAYHSNPWKNGGGVTHEIAVTPGPLGFLWRLSLADVAADGPFSLFEGYARILTVVDGAGMSLRAKDSVLEARPFAPLAFSGAMPLDGALTAGAVRNLNVIFDPKRVAAHVSVLQEGQAEISAHPAQTRAVFAAQGSVRVNDTPLKAHGCALWSDQIAGVHIDRGGLAVVVALGPTAAP